MLPMKTLYPAIEPFDTGRLKVSDIHELYYEQCGNPNGRPVVFLHGGPGGGLQPFYRQYFDPQAYRVVLLDQRGSGKSTPHANLEENTTWHLPYPEPFRLGLRMIPSLKSTL
jgi:proline iminopeptidase